LSENEKSSWLDNVLRLILRQTVGNVAKIAERFVKRTRRLVAVVLTGVIIGVLGVAFFAVGAVKWFSLVIPIWQAWAIVGIILLLVGAALAGATLIGSRA
jgi:putative Ca2+/H+ antiporter (TMEM165/GDT1 family)